MRRTSFITAILLLSCSLTVHADFGFGLKFGTPGAGLDLTKDLTDTVNARVGVNFFSLDQTSESDEGESGEEIDISLDLLTVPVLVDWHPGAGGFRLSAGLVINNNKLSLSASPNETVDINDREYTITSLDGEATFSQICPYLGLGWGNAASSEDGNWHFSFDLGVMFQGAPDIELNATASNPALQASLNSDIEEEKQDIEDDAEVFNMYPVLSLGISYTF